MASISDAMRSVPPMDSNWPSASSFEASSCTCQLGSVSLMAAMAANSRALRGSLKSSALRTNSCTSAKHVGSRSKHPRSAFSASRSTGGTDCNKRAAWAGSMPRLRSSFPVDLRSAMPRNYAFILGMEQSRQVVHSGEHGQPKILDGIGFGAISAGQHEPACDDRDVQPLLLG